MLQLLLPVLGGNQLFSAAVFWRFSFSSFSFMESNSFLNNGQNKSDQLFTVDRLWLGQCFRLYLYVIFYMLSNYIIFQSRTFFAKLKFILLTAFAPLQHRYMRYTPTSHPPVLSSNSHRLPLLHSVSRRVLRPS